MPSTTSQNTSLYTHLPSCPGVYLMHNAENKIVYIGKSNNLRSRVRSYFVPWAELNFAKKKMVHVIDHIDYIETRSDLEALMLETNLIKKHQPKYNVLMKDGKNLSYLKITQEPIPSLIRTRIKTEKGEYFGPYSQYFDAWKYMRFVRKLFRLGNHTKLDTGGKNMPPCMDFYLDLCPGHCTGEAWKIEEYLRRLAQARKFLQGDHESILVDLRAKMSDAATQRKYEDALEYKGMIEQIEATGNRQIVRDVIDGDALVVVALEKYEQTFVSMVEIRQGMTVGIHEYSIRNPLEDDISLLIAEAVMQFMGQGNDKNYRCILTDCDLMSTEEFRDFAREATLEVKKPARGEKVRLLEFAHTNLLNFAYRETMESFKKATMSKKTMINLGSLLWLATAGWESQKEVVFECFDISHSHGEHTVASKSVIVNGKPEPKRYKKYRIKTLKTGEIDDFASMQEILTRRTLAALRGEDPFPDMIIIDGGKWQLSHAVAAISEVLGAEEKNHRAWTNIGIRLTPPPVISLAKREEEIFLPWKSDPIVLEKGSSELMVIQKIRDEAHRFAINYNRASREKSYTKTIFDEIPGIWPVTRKKILQKISRLEDLQTWSYEEAQRAFGKKGAEALADHGLLRESDHSPLS